MILIRSTTLPGKLYKEGPSASLMFKTWLNIYSSIRLKKSESSSLSWLHQIMFMVAREEQKFLPLLETNKKDKFRYTKFCNLYHVYSWLHLFIQDRTGLNIFMLAKTTVSILKTETFERFFFFFPPFPHISSGLWRLILDIYVSTRNFQFSFVFSHFFYCPSG